MSNLTKVISGDTVINKTVLCETDSGQDEAITLMAHSDGLVFWCSKWENIFDLAKLGVVIKSEAGQLGHYDFHLHIKALVVE